LKLTSNYTTPNNACQINSCDSSHESDSFLYFEFSIEMQTQYVRNGHFHKKGNIQVALEDYIDLYKIRLVQCADQPCTQVRKPTR